MVQEQRVNGKEWKNEKQTQRDKYGIKVSFLFIEVGWTINCVETPPNHFQTHKAVFLYSYVKLNYKWTEVLNKMKEKGREKQRIMVRKLKKKYLW